MKESFQNLAARTTVVLIGTLYGGNLGSVARAMHNFGFERLRLAAPQADTGSDDARKMAMESKDILGGAVRFGTLVEAVADADITVGTTRRKGRRRGRYFTPPEMAEALAALDGEKKVAIIFGPEDAGLSNDDIKLCDWLVTIDTRSDFDSLNLSHAVAVILYEIHRAYHAVGAAGAAGAAAKGGQTKLEEGLLEHAEELLRGTGFLTPPRDSQATLASQSPRDPKRVMLSLRRMIRRAGMSKNEINLIHAAIRHIENQLGK
ncbi:MAG: RNA methyltransferase [bacterium]